MVRKTNLCRGFAGLTLAVASLCLISGSAMAQRGGGGGGRQGSRSAGGSAQSNATSSTGTNTGKGSCPQGGSGSASSTTSGTTTGTSTSSGTVATSSSGITAQQTSSAITASRVSASSVQVAYTGSVQNVSKVYIGVLDANGKVISQRAITTGSAQAVLSTNASAKYYGVQVVYANGTVNNSYKPIR